jgi:hypothetical protein
VGPLKTDQYQGGRRYAYPKISVKDTFLIKKLIKLPKREAGDDDYQGKKCKGRSISDQEIK